MLRMCSRRRTVGDVGPDTHVEIVHSVARHPSHIGLVDPDLATSGRAGSSPRSTGSVERTRADAQVDVVESVPSAPDGLEILEWEVGHRKVRSDVSDALNDVLGMWWSGSGGLTAKPDHPLRTPGPFHRLHHEARQAFPPVDVVVCRHPQ